MRSEQFTIHPHVHAHRRGRRMPVRYPARHPPRFEQIDVRREFDAKRPVVATQRNVPSWDSHRQRMLRAIVKARRQRAPEAAATPLEPYRAQIGTRQIGGRSNHLPIDQYLQRRSTGFVIRQRYPSGGVNALNRIDAPPAGSQCQHQRTPRQFLARSDLHHLNAVLRALRQKGRQIEGEPPRSGHQSFGRNIRPRKARRHLAHGHAIDADRQSRRSLGGCSTRQPPENNPGRHALHCAHWRRAFGEFVHALQPDIGICHPCAQRVRATICKRRRYRDGEAIVAIANAILAELRVHSVGNARRHDDIVMDQFNPEPVL